MKTDMGKSIAEAEDRRAMREANMGQNPGPTLPAGRAPNGNESIATILVNIDKQISQLGIAMENFEQTFGPVLGPPPTENTSPSEAELANNEQSALARELDDMVGRLERINRYANHLLSRVEL